MRHQHEAGEKAFVDDSGKRPIVIGASNLTHVEVTRTQTGPDIIGSHVRPFSDFGASPKSLCPINFGARCEVRVATSPRSRARTRSLALTAARRSFQRVGESHTTKRRSKSACKSLNDGSSPRAAAERDALLAWSLESGMNALPNGSKT
jgi:hypothetical protein